MNYIRIALVGLLTTLSSICVAQTDTNWTEGAWKLAVLPDPTWDVQEVAEFDEAFTEKGLYPKSNNMVRGR